jgi:hypothetical protein
MTHDFDYKSLLFYDLAVIQRRHSEFLLLILLILFHKFYVEISDS